MNSPLKSISNIFVKLPEEIIKKVELLIIIIRINSSILLYDKYRNTLHF